ncbi:MAG: DUF5665 domain-containing protein [Patescibacteria group bacterium]
MKENNERGARQAVLEDLFYDFNRSRVQIYKMNFVRGILFGAGSVIGGTVVIALLVWALSLLGNVVPPLGEFFDGISTTLDPTDER